MRGKEWEELYFKINLIKPFIIHSQADTFRKF